VLLQIETSPSLRAISFAAAEINKQFGNFVQKIQSEDFFSNLGPYCQESSKLALMVKTAKIHHSVKTWLLEVPRESHLGYLPRHFCDEQSVKDFD
jgi:hypothetical protein